MVLLRQVLGELLRVAAEGEACDEVVQCSGACGGGAVVGVQGSLVVAEGHDMEMFAIGNVLLTDGVEHSIPRA